MKRTTILALVLALVLVVGAVFVSANVIGNNNAEEKPVVIANQPACGCGCGGQCGGTCGVASCGCGK